MGALPSSRPTKHVPGGKTRAPTPARRMPHRPLQVHPVATSTSNRHVNSSRYIELLLNRWSLDFHDRNRLTRFRNSLPPRSLLRRRGGECVLPTTPRADKLATRAEIRNNGRSLYCALLRFSLPASTRECLETTTPAAHPKPPGQPLIPARIA